MLHCAVNKNIPEVEVEVSGLWGWEGGLNKNTSPWGCRKKSQWGSRQRKRPWDDPDQGQEEDDPQWN